uniref:Uncharacterized protein n=1 Tax=viral metagenome TaxID=1070528 RepID=A0A6M3JZR4_9ZZZZ
MPANKAIQVNCKLKDCYWNLGKYKNNCASREILLQDNRCAHFITKQEAEQRLKDIATYCTM